MRGFFVILGAVFLIGCTAEHRAENATAADINAAAQAAQGDIDTYAANTLESARSVATTVPKASPEPAPAQRVAAPPATVSGGQHALLADPGREPRPCADQGIAQAVGQTRVTGRADDAEFDRPDGDAPAQRATADVWRKGDGQTVSAGREAGELPIDTKCFAK